MSNCRVGSISRVLVVLQKANNVVARYHFCEMPFMLGPIFDKRSAHFVTLCQRVPQMLGGFSRFDQAPL